MARGSKSRRSGTAYDVRENDPAAFGIANAIVNPGAGPIIGLETTQRRARSNLRAFAHELERRFPGLGSLELGRLAGEKGGRFATTLRSPISGREVEVEMPGLRLEDVRYLGSAGQNIFDFPRLYVDGSSWVWCYALEVAAESLGEEH